MTIHEKLLNRLANAVAADRECHPNGIALSDLFAVFF
jgi:hypothetical protein